METTFAKIGEGERKQREGRWWPTRKEGAVVTDKIILKHDSEVSVEETSILRSERKQAFGSYVK